MTSDAHVPTIDGMPITDVRTKHWFRDGDGPHHLPTTAGAGGWEITPWGVASAHRWAETWSAGDPPRGIRKSWREYALTRIWDNRRRGEQRVEVIVVFQEPGRRVQFDSMYVDGKFTEGKWREEIGREPTMRGIVPTELAWLADPKTLMPPPE